MSQFSPEKLFSLYEANGKLNIFMQEFSCPADTKPEHLAGYVGDCLLVMLNNWKDANGKPD